MRKKLKMRTNIDPFLNDSKPKNYRRRALFMTLIAMIAVYVLWNIPMLGIILYPLRLFTTYVHEAGHTFAALATGSDSAFFLISFDGSGLTSRTGGINWLIGPAGYLGAALFGSLLFYFINRFPRTINATATVLGIAMIIFTLLFARPDEGGLPLALFLGVGAGTAIMGIGLRANALITMLVLNVLAVSTALEAFFDLRYLIFFTDASRGSVANDAVNFSERVTPWISPTIIAATWATIAVIMFATALYYGAWKPLQREINETYDKDSQ
jgi:peptidase M50B-like protein